MKLKEFLGFATLAEGLVSMPAHTEKKQFVASKIPLTDKQKKARKRNKMQRKSRQINRTH